MIPGWEVVVGFLVTMAWIFACVGVWFKFQGRRWAIPMLFASLLPHMVITAFLVLTSPPY